MHVHPFLILCILLTLATAACARSDTAGRSAPHSRAKGLPRLSGRAAYPKLEASFALAGLTGNSFDYAENDVRVTFRGPRGETISVPAFFDGGSTWRVRYTPRRPGAYTLTRVTRNGADARPQALEPRSFSVQGKPGPGFIRLDPEDPARFRFDNGNVYYPLGENAAWQNGRGPSVPALLAHMGSAGENWARVWMCHWDGKNLDWPPDGQGGPGALSLDVARRWDGIVDAAEQNGIYLQIALQHHGQYSSRVDPNWNANPWNAKNGGFLATPEEFFTNPHARTLTRAKYRYILARWGYSPHILAWELFNEVQWTDAIRNQHADTVAAWHREMAVFLRQQDPNHHLITTSSDTKIPGLFDAMDYVQPHTYPSDPIPAVTQWKPSEWRRPVFLGEVGPGGRSRGEEARFLHSALWASLMSESSGAAQFWYWDVVERLNLYPEYRAAAAFLKASRLASVPDMRARDVEVATPDQGAVSFGPGGGWASTPRTEFAVPPSGEIDGLEGMPAFLQGNAHREMFPRADFQVDYGRPGAFAVSVRQAAKSGAHLVLAVDGRTAAERDFPPAAADQSTDAVLTAALPAGKHLVRIENTGADWVVLDRFTLSSYGPSLRALAKATEERVALWVYPADAAEQRPPGPATVTVPDLVPGRYRVRWWDTHTGREMPAQSVSVSRGGALVLAVPPMAGDVAGFAARTSGS